MDFFQFEHMNRKRNFYGEKLALLFQIRVIYQDESSEVIGSDASWKASTGPILESEIYHGEVYDARHELDGWSEPNFDDHHWKSVKVIDHPKDVLVASYGPPVRKIQEIKPKKRLTQCVMNRCRRKDNRCFPASPMFPHSFPFQRYRNHAE